MCCGSSNCNTVVPMSAFCDQGGLLKPVTAVITFMVCEVFHFGQVSCFGPFRTNCSAFNCADTTVQYTHDVQYEVYHGIV